MSSPFDAGTQVDYAGASGRVERALGVEVVLLRSEAGEEIAVDPLNIRRPKRMSGPSRHGLPLAARRAPLEPIGRSTQRDAHNDRLPEGVSRLHGRPGLTLVRRKQRCRAQQGRGLPPSAAHRSSTRA